MEFDKKGLIFSSLIGAGQTNRFQIVQNELSKHVLPPVPFLGATGQSVVKEQAFGLEADLWKSDVPVEASEQFFPLSFSLDNRNTWYLLPYEPMLNIKGGNSIIRRNVAKAITSKGQVLGGSIKERWTQRDYEITITGVLMGSILTGDVSDCYPIEDFTALRDVLIAAQSIEVKCEPLHLLGIDRIVVEDFNFPFTKGENVQAYEIKAYSDFDYKLLLELGD
ncbi:DUF6046 domain-containing protein [Formosa sp. S-31]|uniref:DUF6046 domain-containing protein n=1 Tax=Formosa sp. S-31 TaxID=2790949 RepID=UPI003EB6A9C3